MLRFQYGTEKYFDVTANKAFAAEHKKRPPAEKQRWAGREKVALISFGYQNIFAISVSFDSGKRSTLAGKGVSQ